jgi:hypothetical protein
MKTIHQLEFQQGTRNSAIVIIVYVIHCHQIAFTQDFAAKSRDGVFKTGESQHIGVVILLPIINP